MIVKVPRPGGCTLYDRVDTDDDEALACAIASKDQIEKDFRVVLDLLRQAIITIQAERVKK